MYRAASSREIETNEHVALQWYNHDACGIPYTPLVTKHETSKEKNKIWQEQL